MALYLEWCSPQAFGRSCLKYFINNPFQKGAEKVTNLSMDQEPHGHSGCDCDIDIQKLKTELSTQSAIIGRLTDALDKIAGLPLGHHDQKKIANETLQSSHTPNLVEKERAREAVIDAARKFRNQHMENDQKHGPICSELAEALHRLDKCREGE
jgi:hypothetical protein